MRLQIVSKRDGFRRCGIAHSSSPVVHPADAFSAAEVKRLKAEPMLVVVELPDEDEPSKGKGKSKDGGEGAKGEAK